MNTEPAALIRAWLTKHAGTVHITTQVDPAQGLPQLLIDNVRLRARTHRDNRIDPAIRTIDVAVSGIGAGGPRPDYAAAWAALAPVLAAAEQLPSSPWTSATGDRLVSASGLIVTRALDDATGAAMQIATFQVTFVPGP